MVPKLIQFMSIWFDSNGLTLRYLFMRMRFSGIFLTKIAATLSAYTNCHSFFSSKVTDNGELAPAKTEVIWFLSRVLSQPGWRLAIFKYCLPHVSPYMSERPSKNTLY